MASAYPILNLGLAFIGIFLLTILNRAKIGSERLIKYVFVGYYLIVLQYNHDRILTFPNFLLVSVAGIVLAVWTYTSVEPTEAI